MKEHIEPALKTDEGAEFMTSTQIMDFLNGRQDQVKYLSSAMLGKSLTRAGFVKSKKGTGNLCKYGYYVKKCD